MNSRELDRKILEYVERNDLYGGLNAKGIANKIANNHKRYPHSEFIEDRINDLTRKGLLNHGSRISQEGLQLLSNYENLESTRKLREQQRKNSAVETIFTIALLIFAGLEAQNMTNQNFIIPLLGLALFWALLIGGKNLLKVTKKTSLLVVITTAHSLKKLLIFPLKLYQEQK